MLNENPLGWFFPKCISWNHRTTPFFYQFVELPCFIHSQSITIAYPSRLSFLRPLTVLKYHKLLVLGSFKATSKRKLLNIACHYIKSGLIFPLSSTTFICRLSTSLYKVKEKDLIEQRAFFSKLMTWSYCTATMGFDVEENLPGFIDKCLETILTLF